MKGALKEWHVAHAHNLSSRIDSLKVWLSALDLKGEEDNLSEAELEEMHGVTTDIHSLSRLQASINWQQSRSRWLKEGDANSKYFHSMLASRRRGNAISSVQVDVVFLEGVHPVRQAVFSHFATNFKARDVVRPGVENLMFKRLSVLEGCSLTKPFSETEVKDAIWDFDSFKSPGPDGVNFGFYKDFWEEMNGDVMRFISEFHRNGKLTKGLNSTFIALIPKDRQILDGILIANEVVDEARRSKKELMLFKGFACGPPIVRVNVRTESEFQQEYAGWG
ncbi:hypothetical protein QL285_032424 [Trifolium repens]|nr:hypothetical protein QL285_032424 [Trifolium repens]